MLKASGASGNASVKLGMLFSKLPISPNTWTVIALLPAFLGLSGLVDAIDGAVARVTGAVSNLGAFLDGIIDRYVELLLYMGLLVFLMNSIAPDLFIPHVYWIALLISGGMLPTFVRAYADHRGLVTEKEDLVRMGGLIERGERLGMVFAGMILGAFHPSLLVYMLASTAVLSHITAVQRIVFALRI